MSTDLPFRRHRVVDRLHRLFPRRLPGRLSRLFSLTVAACLLAAGCAPPAGDETVGGAPPVAGEAGAAPEGAEILWDTWGVPHIYAADPVDLFHAFGWAQAESHGDLILRLYGRARGRAAEYWGEEYLDGDRWMRVNGVPGRAEEWLATQKPDFRAYLEAFAAGINDYAAAHGDRLDDEVEVVLPVSGADVLAHLQQSIHFTFMASPGVAQGVRRRLQAGSNAWAIAPSRTAGGHAMLLANPHLPWGDLFLFYEVHLNTDDLNLYGATLVGLPALGIAFNDRLGWTHTVNTFDGTDAYLLTLQDDGYLFDGEVRPFEARTETLKVRTADGGVREETLEILHSVHGPVIAREGERAVAMRVAGLDAPDTLEQWWDMSHARDLASFEAALKRLQIPMFTVMYADADGHILHLFGGRTPVRSQGDWDTWSGVVPGDTSEVLWTTTHDYDDLPRVVDPASGWLQNANDPPWTTTFPPALDPEDYPAYMAPRGMSLRPQMSARLVDEDASFTFDELVRAKHSTRVEAADRLLDDLLPALRASGKEIAGRAANVLESWDRTTDADARGAVLFVLWFSQAARGGSLFAEPWDPSRPRTTPDGLADPEAAVAAMTEVAAEVETKYGALDVPWGDVFRITVGEHDAPASGGPGFAGVFRVLVAAPGDDDIYRVQHGDSFVAAVEFADPVRARVLMSYGNATQPHSPHVGDQVELLSRQELREAWLTREQVEANLGRRETLNRR